MKKLVSLLFLCPYLGFSQSNTFPATGNVGIGTTTPAAKLDVKGAVWTDITNAPALYSKSPLGFVIQQANVGNDFNSALNYYSIFAHNLQFNGTNWIRRNQYSNSWSTTLGYNYYDIHFVDANGSDPANTIVNPKSYLRISANGNVGIGSLNPQSKLDVEGNVSMLTGSHKMYFNELYSFDNTKAGFRNNTGNLVMNAKNGGVLYLNRDVTAETRIQSYSGSDAIDIAVFKPNGSVGIGALDPQAKLDVEGNVSILTGLHKMYFNELSSFDNTKAGFRNNAGNLIMNAKSGGILYLNRDVTAETHIQSFSGSDAIDIAVFKPNGSVGIGTSNTNDPSFRLFVETGIRTRRVKVDAYAWADYVFHPGYQLNSLPEVEHFINTHQHLPDVPSAAEVEKNGLDLGDTQALLLKKIEELTLYLIVQNKKIEMLTRKVAQLENSGIR